jgi:Spy/CpxP family protein refolding chaperone
MKPVTMWMLVGCLLGWMPVAGAQPGSGAMKKRVLREIGLNEGQIQKVMELTYAADRAKVDIHASVEKARMDLQQMMAADQPDRNKVFPQIEAIGKLEVELHKNRIGLMLEIRKLVTPEQWEKLEMIWAKHRMDHRGNRKERRERRTKQHRLAPPVAP